MRRPLVPALVVIAAVIAACAAPAAPGWTYAPAPSTTPAASAAASGSPAASASASGAASPSAAASSSAAASASAAASGSPAASGGTGGGLTITAPVGAAANGFNTKSLSAAPGHAFTVTFDNQDAGVPHNWVLTKLDGSTVDIGDTTFFNGVAQKTYNVPALAAGQYPFMCQVHPTTMKGILTVG